MPSIPSVAPQPRCLLWLHDDAQSSLQSLHAFVAQLMRHQHQPMQLKSFLQSLTDLDSSSQGAAVSDIAFSAFRAPAVQRFHCARTGLALAERC